MSLRATEISTSYVQQDVSWIFVTIATVVLCALVCLAFQMVQDLKNVYDNAQAAEKTKRDIKPTTQFMQIDNSFKKRPLLVSRSCSSFFDMDPIEHMKKIV